MRFVFALLAVIGLLASPVAAAVAPAGCDHPASASMHCATMASMPGMSNVAVKGPVDAASCDHLAKHNKAVDPGCAQACAAACVVALALAPPFKATEFVSVRAATPTPRVAFVHPFEPQGLKRPPKSMG